MSTNLEQIYNKVKNREITKLTDEELQVIVGLSVMYQSYLIDEQSRINDCISSFPIQASEYRGVLERSSKRYVLAPAGKEFMERFITLLLGSENGSYSGI